MSIAARLAGEALAAQQKAETHELRNQYRELVAATARLPDWERLSSEQLAQLATLCHRIGISQAEYAGHVNAWKRLTALRAERDEIERQRDALPRPRELRSQIDELDAQLAPQIDALLEPKRQLERSLDDRLALEEAAREAGSAVSRVELQVPILTLADR